MKISILALGRVREKYINMGIDEFSKRLSRYVDLEIIEIADEPAGENLSDKEMEQVKEKEGEKILARLDDRSYKIALDIKGKSLDSIGLAEFIEDKMTYGTSHISFIIGGSLGLSDEVLRTCDYRLSFSKLTFPHQLMRLILLEQVYRSFRIIKKEPYHK